MSHINTAATYFAGNVGCWQETSQGYCEISENYDLAADEHANRHSLFVLVSLLGTISVPCIPHNFSVSVFFSPRLRGCPLSAGWQGCWGCSRHWRQACVRSSWSARWPAAGQGRVDEVQCDRIRSKRPAWSPVSGTASQAGFGFDEGGTWSFPGGFVPVETHTQTTTKITCISWVCYLYGMLDQDASMCTFF